MGGVGWGGGFSALVFGLNCCLQVCKAAQGLGSGHLSRNREQAPCGLLYTAGSQGIPIFFVGSISDSAIDSVVAVCHSFCLFFIFYNIHTIIQSHSYNTFAEASLHLLIACKLSGTDLPVVPSRESKVPSRESKSAEPRIENQP